MQLIETKLDLEDRVHVAKEESRKYALREKENCT